MLEIMAKNCIRCNSELSNIRKKFCSNSCKFWFNKIKKDQEAHLPPASKRTANWFYCLVGVRTEFAKSKRSGLMVSGNMCAATRHTVEELLPASPENIARHFEGLPEHKPSYAAFGDGSFLTREEAMQKFLNAEKP